ncbi:hypothetical protein SAMN04488009_0474 [Maribacter sedimenticola]|uniref:Uncharacterized protein n=1 Tax=Maribacter sedimenticola TaxID=228956 RepID=A0ABY1SCU1_9FLAO|nr:hypothetical protein [Maribacter sedimenticola]SNR26229.1 hypothetical protein SAMN04488009_0474 [Maribacter sedimenticola]
MKTKTNKNMEKTVKFYVYKTFKIFFYILLGIGIAFLVGYIFMRLWNWLMPYLFGLPEVDYWMALGILLLSKIIFGFGGGNGSGNSKKKKKKDGFKKDSCSNMKWDFSQWKHYDDFWAEEGEQSYKNYIEKKRAEAAHNPTKP